MLLLTSAKAEELCRAALASAVAAPFIISLLENYQHHPAIAKLLCALLQCLMTRNILEVAQCFVEAGAYMTLEAVIRHQDPHCNPIPDPELVPLCHSTMRALSCEGRINVLIAKPDPGGLRIDFEDVRGVGELVMLLHGSYNVALNSFNLLHQLSLKVLVLL